MVGRQPLSVSVNSYANESNDWTQPLPFFYYDAQIREISPRRGLAYQQDVTLHVDSLRHATDAVHATAYSAPFSRARLPSGSLLADLGPSMLRSEMVPPIIPAALGDLLVLASANCRVRVVALSTAADGAPQAVDMPSHGAVAVGEHLAAAGETMCAPAIGDLDGDGLRDVLVGGASGRVRRTVPMALRRCSCRGRRETRSSRQTLWRAFG